MFRSLIVSCWELSRALWVSMCQTHFPLPCTCQGCVSLLVLEPLPWDMEKVGPEEGGGGEDHRRAAGQGQALGWSLRVQTSSMDRGWG